jgi:hypothetical protein
MTHPLMAARRPCGSDDGDSAGDRHDDDGGVAACRRFRAPPLGEYVGMRSPIFARI